MNIGIISDFSKSPFSNGLTQNIIHLKKCLNNCGFNVSYIDFSTYMDQTINKSIKNFIKEKDIINFKNIKNKDISKIDIILSAGVNLSPSKINFFRSINKKIKIIGLRYGNVFVQRMQRWSLFKEEPSTLYEKPHNKPAFDAYLYSPHFKRFRELEQIENMCPVDEIPYLWSPNILNKIAAENNLKIDYIPNKKKELAVFEPNVEISKSCLVPLMAIMHLLRSKPDSFDAATILGTEKFNHSIKKYINNNLNLQAHKDKVFFEGRYQVAYILHKFNPTFVSHQLMCELNYVYLEALYFGYPLIHNSTMLENQGYYYNEYNAIECSQRILESQEKHDDNFKQIQQTQKDFTYQFDADNPEVINKYIKLMERLINL